MPVLNQSPTLGDLLEFELNGNYSRESVTLKAGTNYALGSVLGKITRVALGLLGHPATALLCPHPELESQSSLDRNPSKPIFQTDSHDSAG